MSLENQKPEISQKEIENNTESTIKSREVVVWDRNYLILGTLIVLIMTLFDTFAALFASTFEPFTTQFRWLPTVFSASGMATAIILYYYTRKGGLLHAEFAVVLSFVHVSFCQIMQNYIALGDFQVFYCLAFALVCIKCSYGLRGVVKTSGLRL